MQTLEAMRVDVGVGVGGRGLGEQLDTGLMMLAMRFLGSGPPSAASANRQKPPLLVPRYQISLRFRTFTRPSDRTARRPQLAPTAPSPQLAPSAHTPCLYGSIIVTWISGKYLGSHHVLSPARDPGKPLLCALHRALLCSALPCSLSRHTTNTLQILAELCTYLVEDVYGELAAVCLSCLPSSVSFLSCLRARESS
jgi:hypothetical protein